MKSGKRYYRWRQVAIEFAGEDAKPLDVALRAAEVFGKDIGKSFLPRMNWLKGEDGFLMILARSLADLWNTEGGLATVEKGENPGELFIKCARDPWPTWAKQWQARRPRLPPWTAPRARPRQSQRALFTCSPSAPVSAAISSTTTVMVSSIIQTTLAAQSLWSTESPQCQDGIDNDNDGKIDYDGGLSALGYVAAEPDPYCAGKPWQNRESKFVPAASAPSWPCFCRR